MMMLVLVLVLVWLVLLVRVLVLVLVLVLVPVLVLVTQEGLRLTPSHTHLPATLCRSCGLTVSCAGATGKPWRLWRASIGACLTPPPCSPRKPPGACRELAAALLVATVGN